MFSLSHGLVENLNTTCTWADDDRVKEKIGQYFVRMNLLSIEDTTNILLIQQIKSHRKFGELAVELGYLMSGNIEQYLKSRSYNE